MKMLQCTKAANTASALATFAVANITFAISIVNNLGESQELSNLAQEACGQSRPSESISALIFSFLQQKWTIAGIIGTNDLDQMPLGTN
ncbi:MAG: hypothetical protein JHD35_14960 [Sphingopyxis sp.]|nr:hypothetical protein [Sphingopyxis sp.]